jgi:hypothetical protein
MASSTMPTTSKTTAASLILAVIGVDQMISAAWIATVMKVSNAALVGVYSRPSMGCNADCTNA